MIEGTAESLLERFYRSWVKPGDCAIDIGAHTGRHTIPLAEAVGQGGKVFAFEPLPVIFEQLRARVSRAGWAGVVELKRAAVAVEPGVATFVVAVDRPEESGLRERAFYNGDTRIERISVDVIVLDGFVPGDVDVRFVKIDVEGAEFGVFRGAERLIRRCGPAIGFEFGAQAAAAFDTSPDDVFDWLQAMGYAIFDLRGHRHVRESFADRCGTAMIWDYVAIPDGAPAIAGERMLRDHYRSSIAGAPRDDRSDDEYVRDCYRELLGREADAGGLGYYAGLLAKHGWTRAEVAAALRNSDEYRQRR